MDDETLMKVAGLFGEEAVRIVEALKDVGEIKDVEITSQTEIRLNSVRKTLYRLYDHSLVALRRSRDRDTGWYIFHWRLQPDQVGGFILNQKRRVLEKLETRLEYEKSHEFYRCSTPSCKRVPFEEAVELVFRCPKCGRPMMHFDNKRIVEALTRRVERIRRELSEV